MYLELYGLTKVAPQYRVHKANIAGLPALQRPAYRLGMAWIAPILICQTQYTLSTVCPVGAVNTSVSVNMALANRCLPSTGWDMGCSRSDGSQPQAARSYPPCRLSLSHEQTIPSMVAFVGDGMMRMPQPLYAWSSVVALAWRAAVAKGNHIANLTTSVMLTERATHYCRISSV